MIAMTPSQNERPIDARRRTLTAIALAVGIGVLVGLLMHANVALRLVPVLLGQITCLAAAIVVPAGLCLLATNRYPLIGLGFAAGVALAIVAANVATRGIGNLWTEPIAQFALIFVIVSCPALLSTGICAISKRKKKSTP
jgi:hypothetical protein